MMKVLKAVKVILNTISKIFLVIAVFVVIINLFLHFTSQDKPKLTHDPIQKNREEIYKVINDVKLNKTKEGKITIALYRSVLCGTIGEACTDNPNDADKNYQKSVFGFMAKLIILPYVNPPASGVYYVYDSLSNAGFIPKALAAEGIGLAALRPFSNLWKVFRDIAYLILVLVLVAIGFMIMFRMKMNPQTIISLENALPKMIISLILITFSFAIAGFLIDLMYVIILLAIFLLSDRGNFFNVAEFQNKYINAGFTQIWSGMFPGTSKAWAGGGIGNLMRLSQAFINLLPDFINHLLRLMLGVAGTVLVPYFVATHFLNLGDTFRDFAGGTPAQILTALLSFFVKLGIIGLFATLGFGLGYSILPIVILILISLTFVFMLFRIFFMLIATYIRIFLMIIFSPVLLMFEAVPGVNIFAWWIKNLFVELLTFPIIIILFIAGYIIVNVTANAGPLWRPPFLTDINPNAFTIILGVGIIFMIPELVKAVRELTGAKGMPISLGLGTFFQGAGTGIGGGLGLLGQFSSLLIMFPALRSRGPGLLQNLMKDQPKPTGTTAQKEPQPITQVGAGGESH